MSLIWEAKDFADEERRERLEYLQDQRWPRFYVFLVWVLMIFVSAGMWGLALTVGRWIWSFIP